jgi:hypothetical protein
MGAVLSIFLRTTKPENELSTMGLGLEAMVAMLLDMVYGGRRCGCRPMIVDSLR